MREVLFVQGAGEDVHAKWDVHLVESLRRELGPQYDIHYPLMPNEADPTVASWGPVLERELATLRPGAIVMGHSVGATMLIQTLAHSTTTAALAAIVLLAAPFIGPGGWEIDEMETSQDLAARLPSDTPVFLYHGEDDTIVPVAHVERYAETIPHAHLRRLAGRDHQLNNDLSDVARDIRDLRVTSP